MAAGSTALPVEAAVEAGEDAIPPHAASNRERPTRARVRARGHDAIRPQLSGRSCATRTGTAATIVCDTAYRTRLERPRAASRRMGGELHWRDRVGRGCIHAGAWHMASEWPGGISIGVHGGLSVWVARRCMHAWAAAGCRQRARVVGCVDKMVRFPVDRVGSKSIQWISMADARHVAPSRWRST